jgi:hypothetical protein
MLGGQKEVRAFLPKKISVHPCSVDLRSKKGENKTLKRRKIKSSGG